MIDQQILPYLKLAHGLYNTLVIALFFYQGSLGLAIRRARRSSAPIPVKAVKRHRKLGPLLVLAGCLGFFAGLSLVLIDEGNVLEYPLHLLVGFAIVMCLISTYMLSLRIKGPTSPVRTLHFILGITILCLYVIQAFIGLGILL